MQPEELKKTSLRKQLPVSALRKQGQGGVVSQAGKGTCATADVEMGLPGLSGKEEYKLVVKSPRN